MFDGGLLIAPRLQIGRGGELSPRRELHRAKEGAVRAPTLPFDLTGGRVETSGGERFAVCIL